MALEMQKCDKCYKYIFILNQFVRDIGWVHIFLKEHAPAPLPAIERTVFCKF